MNAVDPPATLTVAKELEAHALAMLHEAWDTPHKLGEQSDICRRATELFYRIRRFSSPSAEEGNADLVGSFQRVLKLSWLAVWRARDYSVNRWVEQAQNEKWDRSNGFSAGSSLMRPYGHVQWSPLHFPLYDRDGEPLQAPVVVGIHNFASNLHPAMYEGAMVHHQDQLEGRRSQTFQWALFATQWDKIRNVANWDFDFSMWTNEGAVFSFQTGGGAKFRNTTFFHPVQMADFNGAEGLAFLAGGRFEGGLSVRNGTMHTLEFPDIETGPLLELVRLNCSKGVNIAASAGLKKLSVNGPSTNLGPGLALKSDAPVDLDIGSGDGGIGIQELKLSRCHLGRVLLRYVNFTGEVWFDDCTVTGRFVWSNVACLADATFDRTKFKGDFLLDTTRFANDANFERCEFEGATFDVEFDRAARFGSSIFGGPADFDGSVFKGRLTFSSLKGGLTTFYKSVSFKGEPSGEGGDDFASTYFNNVTFDGPANFRNRTFKDDTSFDGAEFSYPPSFHGSSFHPRTSFEGARFLWKDRRVSTRWRRAVIARFQTWTGGEIDPNVAEDNRFFAEAADSFRVATSLAREIDAPELAFQFHKQELRARHHRSVGGAIARSEAVVGRLYGALADYGDSFLRPIIGLLLSTLLFGWLYNGWVDARADRSMAAVLMSGTIQLKPFSHLDTTFGRLPAAQVTSSDPPEVAQLSPAQTCARQLAGDGVTSTSCLLDHILHAHDVELKLFGTLQSLVSVAFIFLAALGLRRKYQVV